MQEKCNHILSDLALVVVAYALLELVHGDQLADVLDDEAALLDGLLDEDAPAAPVRHSHLYSINKLSLIN